jgi:hypothetical protein
MLCQLNPQQAHNQTGSCGVCLVAYTQDTTPLHAPSHTTCDNLHIVQEMPGFVWCLQSTLGFKNIKNQTLRGTHNVQQQQLCRHYRRAWI